MRSPLAFSALLLALFLLSLSVSAQNPVGHATAEAERPDQREAERLRRSLEAMREQSVLTVPLPIGASIPDDAPRFSTRAACVAALGFASVGAEGRLVCRAIVDRFPFKGTDPTPVRLDTLLLPIDADRG
jgi:hypothetical protein